MDNTPENKQPEEDQINLFQWIKEYIRDFVDIRKETDQQATIESIKSDIAFRGHTAWILVCSIFVASIGLNANSTAVVIGAMLISPLMGPILGIALSLAMNDVDLLRRAIKKLFGNGNAQYFRCLFCSFGYFRCAMPLLSFWLEPPLTFAMY
ncbi:DUF389 domain-containing protein [Capnocytophaga canimorsus]|nr:DUF389 domain-containing protein [Capnocytophaga canimorsus]WGU68053.1 DUF389 domain-containing protein [Capnocytophaga canimorsus]